jgi:hypothetical protein
MRTQVVSTTGRRRAGIDERNIDGHAVALTVFSTVRWWGRITLPLFFLYIRVRTSSLGTLRQLSFIHAARWSIVYRLPYNGPPQPRRRLLFPHLYFESNFNGGWEEYIDAFSYVLAGHALLGAARTASRGPCRPGPFKDYIKDNELVASHYYSAYPEATATMVLQALELAPRLAELREAAGSMTPEQFAAAWESFLTEMQSCL